MDSRGRARFAARLAPAAGGLSIVLTIAIGVLGPSAMVPGLPGPSWQPPYSLDLAPDGHLVVALAAAALILGTAGLASGLAYADRMPRARTLVVAGCAAAAVLAFLPPSGSADHLNYAAYGRMAVLGHDPYATVPADLPADPVVGRVEEWKGTPSVYGPVATAVQALASHVGGDSVRLTVFVMALVNAAAFVATGLLLHRATSGDPVRQRRAALLWTANPLIVYELVAGMHLDTVAIAFVVAGLVARRGVPLGLGVAVKATVGLVALGTAWELRRSPRRLALVAGLAALTVLVAYLLAGPHSLDQLLNASKSVSLATPWKLAQRALQGVFGSGAYRVWIQAGSLLLLAALAALLLRGRPAAEREGPVVALAVAVAWLFSTPYALPWYDGLGFALLALVAWPGLEAFLVARLAVLSLAYLPARQTDQPDDLRWLVDVVRGWVAPSLLLALTIALLWWAARSGARVRTPPAPAAPRPSGPSPESRSPSR
ncbi:polyprenol phosphomannose-dependent alpha 1,6 mannosyltransferase MptB [Microbispora siamensis]|uniref:polyprenol phosphomannose-dependent alpha 1,6 mannosyltransferase MptB n=1 Tax=Microbispora siamensis TaxID=564413 RepID=UPI001EF256CD|nr:polyprenol phosphomannose-dependent alpha 1,6 mannosyltransferase MptB [Microbispora siamensis]